MLVDLGISAVRARCWWSCCSSRLSGHAVPGTAITTDIFSYVMYGHISAVYDLNPYIFPPNYFPNNPAGGPRLDPSHLVGPAERVRSAVDWYRLGDGRLATPIDGLVQEPSMTATVLQVG